PTSPVRIQHGESSLDDANVKVAVRVRPMNRRVSQTAEESDGDSAPLTFDTKFQWLYPVFLPETAGRPAGVCERESEVPLPGRKMAVARRRRTEIITHK
ncbi:hypothetical protein KUCAC02_002711, partial [Chaenocephalus aceratus]